MAAPPIYPGLLLPFIPLQFFGDDGEPLTLGTVECFEAGTSTPLSTTSDALNAVANPTTLTLNSAGRTTQPVFLRPQGYKFIVKDQFGTPVQTIDMVETGQVFAATLGNVLASGARNVTSGYSVLSTDYLVTVASTGGPNPCIVNLGAASATASNQPKFILNLGNIPISLTPQGGDTLNTLNAAFTIPAAGAAPSLPVVFVVSDAVSAWFILSAFKVP